MTVARSIFAACILAIVAYGSPLNASPMIVPGDMALRHDIQRLADLGVITGTVTTWPLAWGPIMRDIRRYDAAAALPRDARDAIDRLSARAAWETETYEFSFNARASVAEKPTRIRGFMDTPREQAEISAGISYTSDRFAFALNGQAVDSPSDGEEFRADGSLVAVVLGNYSFSANTLDRWWGPGWDGSLILSNNARPIPAVSIDRNFTDPFDTKWLSWLGPWDLAVHFGQMESDRYVPNTKFFGMRFNFRPIPSLEIGLSRTAQWCGDDRPCDLETFVNLLLGRDNKGGDGIDDSNEPGNQLAGFDVRWAPNFFDFPLAFYGNVIGEDEAGGFPSRYIGQFGIEASGLLGDRWSYRWFGEFAGTSCQFHESSELFNCAYNHSIYRTGYRYRGRVVGHGSDNDSRVISVGLMLVDDRETQWNALLRYGALNRDGSPDPRNSLTPTRQDIASIDLVHSRVFRYGQVDLGLGYEKVDDVVSTESFSDVRAFLRWRSSY